MSDEPVMREVDLEPVTWYFGEHIRVTRAVPAAGLPVVGARLLVTVYVPGDKDRSIVVPADDMDHVREVCGELHALAVEAERCQQNAEAARARLTQRTRELDSDNDRIIGPGVVVG